MADHKPESRILWEILMAWGARPDLRIWRSNTGVAKIEGRTVRFGTPGQADITGVLAGGRRLEIECKTAVGRQNPDQKTFQTMIERFGGLYLLVRSLEECDRELAKVGVTR